MNLIASLIFFPPFYYSADWGLFSVGKRENLM